MICDESAARLHDRASRGEALSPQERADLDAWLAAQDEAEAALLASKGTLPAVVELRSQVDAALRQVRDVTRSIEQASAENDSLRREIASLRGRLAASSVSQPA